MKVKSLVLMSVSLSAGVGVQSAENVSAHMARLGQIPRVPLSLLAELASRRHLFDLEEWGRAGMNMDCFYDDDNGNLECVMDIDGVKYELREECNKVSPAYQNYRASLYYRWHPISDPHSFPTLDRHLFELGVQDLHVYKGL